MYAPRHEAVELALNITLANLAYPRARTEMSRVTDISYCAYHFASTRVVQNRSLITFGGESFGSRVMKKNPDTWATMVAKGGKWTSNKGTPDE